MAQETEILTRLSAPLLRWYDENRRVLPWREEVSAYRTWVSEIMLQQTRVAAVLPYFERFMAAFPDVAALAAAAQGESVIRGTSRLEHKECNRADAIREEYAKAGIEVDISQEDVMRIRGGRIRAARVQSHGDHRMAMSMAVAGLLSDGEMTIEDAECVAKSYPGFFEDLEKIRI